MVHLCKSTVGNHLVFEPGGHLVKEGVGVDHVHVTFTGNVIALSAEAGLSTLVAGTYQCDLWFPGANIWFYQPTPDLNEFVWLQYFPAVPRYDLHIGYVSGAFGNGGYSTWTSLSKTGAYSYSSTTNIDTPGEADNVLSASVA